MLSTPVWHRSVRPYGQQALAPIYKSFSLERYPINIDMETHGPS
ncbi:hypothetical protein [Mastigocoleus sp. MO_188.B34]|nr:hypothetical protein [Mastigocoleus sp. MO_188.B34]